MRSLDIGSEDKLMVSFDIVSLFTNVPLLETIDNCADILYRCNLGPSSIPEELFLEFIRLATEGVEFSFDGTMYAQMDGVAMGTPLGPVLANIFVGYYERILFDKVHKPCVYMRYVDDTFSTFDSSTDATNFLAQLNSLHPSLKFTMEIEEHRALPSFRCPC